MRTLALAIAATALTAAAAADKPGLLSDHPLIILSGTPATCATVSPRVGNSMPEVRIDWAACEAWAKGGDEGQTAFTAILMLAIRDGTWKPMP